MPDEPCSRGPEADPGVNVSLVTTFMNEEAGIEHFLDSIFSLSRLPDELVLVDGGSTDRTVLLVEKYTSSRARGIPVKLIIDRNCNISAGRNRAVREAAHDVIAVTDAGSHLDKNWLKEIVRPFERDSGIDIVAGSYRVEATSVWERLSSSYLMPSPDLISRIMPSGRSSCFRRKAWEDVGGYPEWLNHAEDSYFAIKLRETDHTFCFSPDALVRWKPRPDPLSFFKQYFLYAVGDERAGLYRSKYIRKILMYVLGAVLLARGLTVPLFVLAGVYLVLMMGRYWARGKDRALVFFLPPVVIIHDIAQVAGYLYGKITCGDPS